MKKLMQFLKLAWKVSPLYLLLLFFSCIAEGAKVVFNVVLPMYLVNELLGAQDGRRLLLFAGLIVANNVGMTFLSNTLKRFTDVRRTRTNHEMLELLSKKIMNLEYSYLEDPEYLNLKEQAVFSITNQNSIVSMFMTIAEVFSGLVTLAGLVSVLASLGWVLLIVLAVGIILNFLIFKSVSQYITKLTKEIIPVNRKFGYYAGLVTAKEVQKDIRLYEMDGMLTKRMVDYTRETCDMFEKVMVKQGVAEGQLAAVNAVVTAVSYAYVGIRTISDRFGALLSIGELTMYVSAAVNFTRVIGQFEQNIVGMWQCLSFLTPYLEFMALPEETAQSGELPFDGNIESVEFRHVTFTYPRAEKPVLCDVSFEIKKGEKISIVGLNGAGKSTLVKLLCRMFPVDSGEILVNGRNIYEYDYLSYMNAISAVFQDYKLFNFTIAENISCKAAGADEEKINRLIAEVGMQEKMRELPHGMESRFGKEYDEEGIEMSGGQEQKIAIARALYKKASMVVLDEPASALDPIAEAEIYEKFNSLVEDKTAIYISHRMSSSVFCDRILILDGGTVSDFDTHEHLMQKTDSLYYKLFQSQAENYRLQQA